MEALLGRIDSVGRQSQPTGWPGTPGVTFNETIGGHKVAEDFTFNGKPHRINDVQSYSVFVDEPTATSPGMSFGGDMYVVYHPDRRRGDPLADDSPHWIQVVRQVNDAVSPGSIVDNIWRANMSMEGLLRSTVPRCSISMTYPSARYKARRRWMSSSRRRSFWPKTRESRMLPERRSSRSAAETDAPKPAALPLGSASPRHPERRGASGARRATRVASRPRRASRGRRSWSSTALHRRVAAQPRARGSVG